MIDRAPTGRFIAREATLSAWLPTMLDWARRDILADALSVMADWCSARISERFMVAARWMAETPEYMHGVDWTNKQVAMWRERREILLEAAKKLRGIK